MLILKAENKTKVELEICAQVSSFRLGFRSVSKFFNRPFRKEKRINPRHIAYLYLH